MYTIVRTKRADKDLRKIPKTIALRIISKLEQVAEDPYKPNNNIKPLVGNNAFRLRVGDYRALYYLDDNEIILELVKVKHRKEVYHGYSTH